MSTEIPAQVDAPLKVAFYSPALPDSGASNGIVTYVRVMRDALRDLGHSVFVVTTEHMEFPDGRVSALKPLNSLAASLRMRTAALLGDDRGRLWVQMNVRKAFETARAAGVDVFEIEESFGWAAELTGKGVAIVERLHGPHMFVRDELETPEAKRSGDLRQEAEFASFKKVQAITSPTQRLLDELVPYGLDPSISQVIPNPIPTAGQPSWQIDTADVDQVLFIGRFDLCKGADVAIRAFSQAATRRPSLKLVMAGPNAGLAQPNGARILLDDFLRTDVAPDIRTRIRFLGPVSSNEVGRLRRESGVALITSRFENFPYSIAEAMSVGSPVITSDTFGGAAMIRDGLDGLIVPVGDVSATAQAILTMTENVGRLSEMARSGHSRASHWLSPHRIARETIRRYHIAISSAH